MKKGVLVVNLGTPDAPTRGAVYRYLKEFLLDGRVIDYPWLPRNLLVRGIIAPFRSGSSAKLYKELWTEKGSPLKYHGVNVVKQLEEKLGDDYMVELAMRYQSPSMKSALEKLRDARVSEIIVFPMFPQYASATTGSVHQEVMRITSKWQTIPNIKMINSYYDHPELVSIFADNARDMNFESYDHYLFSFHGVPQRHLRKGDDSKAHCLKVENCCDQICANNQFCYSSQCHATAKAIAEKLGLKKEDYTVCFQSRLGFEEWAQPYTIKTIEELSEKGYKNLLVFSPAFVADCLETIIEIGLEYKEEFEEMGGEDIALVPSLNDNPRWVNTIEDIILKA